MGEVFRTIIVTASNAEAARNAAAQHAGGDDMFTTGLAPVSEEEMQESEYFISSGLMDSAIVAAVEGLAWYCADEAPFAVLAEKELRIV